MNFRKIFVSALVILVANASIAQKPIDVDAEIKHAAEQYKGMLASHPDVTKFPQSLKPDGSQNDRTSEWWCSGFFGGSLWYLFEGTKDPQWTDAAHKWSMAVEKEKFNKGTHDLGFMLYCPFGNGYRLTKNPEYKQIMLTGANSLATRFNPNYGIIKSWDKWKEYDYPVIVDNMMNLEFLFWAARTSGNKKLYDICIAHADNTLKNHFRNDNSSYHVVAYAPGGKVLKQATHQGLADSSAWARGQAWGLYGYTDMYRETKQKKYLDQAEKIATFILNHPNLPEDKIPYWDFDAPGEERDVSAATVMCSALLELSGYSKTNGKKYFDAAEQMLQSLTTPAYKAAIGMNGNFLLMHSVGNKPANSEINTPLVYADYYYLEALLRYKALQNKTGGNTPTPTTNENNGELIFQNGFEGTSHITRSTRTGSGNITPGFETDDIEGTDNSFGQKSDWVKDLDQNPGAGRFFFEYTGGDSTQRTTKIIPEPGNEKNKVLQFWVADSWAASEGQRKARVQASLYGVKKGFKDFTQSVRVYLYPDFAALKKYPGKIGWLTISEFWNNEWWVKDEPYGFRISLGIGKPAGEVENLHFILNGEDAMLKEVWNGDNEAVKVPIGKWFTMKYRYVEGNAATGKFYMTVQPDGEAEQVVFDITNFTHNTKDKAPNGVTGYNPMKLYTSKEVVGFMKEGGKTLQIYWDDFKLWRQK